MASKLMRFFRRDAPIDERVLAEEETGRSLLLQVSIDSGARGHKMFSYVPDLYAASAESARQYAARIGADYLCIHKPVQGLYHGHANWQRFMMFDACFDCYDQVLHVDSDVIIRPDAPDIFSGGGLDRFWAVPVLLSDPDVEPARRKNIEQQVAELGLNLERYFNAGVLLVGRQMRRRIRLLDWRSQIVENPQMLNQPTFNKIVEDHAELSVLDWRFNLLFVREEQADRFQQAYFVHFLGHGKKLFTEDYWRSQLQGPPVAGSEFEAISNDDIGPEPFETSQNLRSI